MGAKQHQKIIWLPEELDADHLEHLGAALLATGGMFVEKNITEKVAYREELEEIDAFGTVWRNGCALKVLIEAKSGQWGGRELFSLLGKKEYLGAHTAVLLHCSGTTKPKHLELAKRFGTKGYKVLIAEASKVTAELIADICEEDEDVVSQRLDTIHSLQTWRYAFWTERVLLKHLIRQAKAFGSQAKSLNEARGLIDRFNGCFFQHDPIEQARLLYDFYFQHPKLTQEIVEERRRIAPGDELRGLSSEQAFSACLYDGKLDEAQAGLYLEHRARCSLLKIAVDLVMTNYPRPPEPSRVKDYLLPASFWKFISAVSQMPSVQKLPQLWQSYVFGWGGFIVLDRENDEYANIGLEIDLKPEQVRAGLKTFDQLFPIEDGWHYEQKDTGLRILKLVPNVIRALGVQRRRWIYGDERFLGKLPPLGFKDCKKWAECGYELLS